MARGRQGRPSQPLIEDPAPLSEARSALLSPRTTSVSPAGTQSSLPGTTPELISTSFTGLGQWRKALSSCMLPLSNPIDVHRSIARNLAAEFPGIPFTGEKLGSKCNQCFKRWYDVLLACKDASGFGWNKQHNMVTASEEVWEAFLRFHPAARRFKNTSFPKYHKLFVIFGGHTATGALCTGANGEGKNNEDVAEEQMGPNAPNRFLGDNVSSWVEQAISKFQDDFAEGLSMEDLVAGFSILEPESKANTFMAIQNKVHAMAWMRLQIKIYNSSHNV
ncbi:hypothetical protein MJO28_008427 [Puccinia striiformis f. sp. tritici]|uniref:Uncharacterized protein n=1 Tax=Puccinia striiformis f. sp. tritici TaxID=168172 RepID=A0ACC0EAE2_9BASI|nr:hypothetical protein MJO28_008427 [Puccinia striiformis f. sp. tritici]